MVLVLCKKDVLTLALCLTHRPWTQTHLLWPIPVHPSGKRPHTVEGCGKRCGFPHRSWLWVYCALSIRSWSLWCSTVKDKNFVYLQRNTSPHTCDIHCKCSLQQKSSFFVRLQTQLTLPHFSMNGTVSFDLEATFALEWDDYWNFRTLSKFPWERPLKSLRISGYLVKEFTGIS